VKILGITTQKNFEVAVFVLTYNQIQYVVECLESILNQKFRNSWHIFVHDDASSDGTKEILEGYYSKYPEKITLLLQDANQFQLGRTIGIDLFKYSRSNFIAYCEGDDFSFYSSRPSQVKDSKSLIKY
jgi:glycosyltransferase involved in cell wall biosynthesis